MGRVKRSGVRGGKGEEKTPTRKHCANEKHGQAAKSPSIEGSTSATKGKSRKSLSFSLLEKIKKPKTLILTSKEVKQNAFASEGKSCRPEIQKPQEINKRVITSQC